MPNQAEVNGADALIAHKKLLVAQGAAFRLEIQHSRNIVRAHLHAESLAKNALSHIVLSAVNALKTGAMFKGGNLQMALPLILGGISALSKKSLLKPIVGGAVVLGVAGTIVRFVWKHKKERRAQRQIGTGG